MKALVTGGAGFIGSHLVEELASRQNEVVIIDDLSSGVVDNITNFMELQAEVKTSSRYDIKFVHESILNLALLKKLFEGIDYVFHQAAIPSVDKSINDPQSTHDVNVTGTLNVLIAARDNNVKKVVFASSCAVYGNSTGLPKREDMTPNPQSIYAANKLAGEYYCQVFYQIYGLPTVCLRYFNVYGPRQNSSSEYAAVIPRFIQSVRDKKSPIIYGDGEQTRDFVSVKDVVEANILAAKSDVVGVYNIGKGESISVNKLAELIIKIMGSRIEPTHQEPKIGEIRHSLAAISKAKQFGYTPKYDIEEALKWQI